MCVGVWVGVGGWVGACVRVCCYARPINCLATPPSSPRAHFSLNTATCDPRLYECVMLCPAGVEMDEELTETKQEIPAMVSEARKVL